MFSSKVFRHTLLIITLLIIKYVICSDMLLKFDMIVELCDHFANVFPKLT